MERVSSIEDTWASGPLELLRHAESHLTGESALDTRLALISVDNAVELMLRVFLSIPREQGDRPRLNSGEVDRISESFPTLLQTCVKLSPSSFESLDLSEIEYHHRLRNKLYHQGMGLGVDPEFVSAYFVTAKGLLQSLLGVKYRNPQLKLHDLRPDARIRFEDEIKQEKAKKHGQRVSDGLGLLKARGIALGRGVVTVGLSPSEMAHARSREAEGWGYKRIAMELNTRRRKKKSNNEKPQVRSELTAAHVRRALKT